MSIDTLWVLVCACLVMFMQAGFTCVESGMVRAKNSINVALKNLIDFCISVPLFALFGFGLMFGASAGGWIGTDSFLVDHSTSAQTLAFFFFQAMFCGTATTIVSGAVAERMRFMGYAFTAVVLSALIYPIAGHWAWAKDAVGAPAGWLARIGFHDFAGSTVVHSVGGWVALAALLVIGPRLGRFGPKGRAIEGHNLALTTLGVFVLWFGWFGFNGGSTLALAARVPLILTNTALAGAAGGVACMLLSSRLRNAPAADETMNGVLAGLVAITAGCDIISPPVSILVGAVGGLVSMLGCRLLERCQVDDAVSAVPVHLFGGVWGTLAVALCAPAGSWGEGVSRGHQFGVQLAGVLVIGAYAFGASYVALKLVGRARLRVSPREERIGLNVSEHGATTSFLELISQMDLQASTGDFRKPVRIENETEASQIAGFYNAVLEKFNLETDRRKMAMQHLSELANSDVLTGLANRRLFFDSVRRALLRPARDGQRRPGLVLYLDLDGFKRINDGLGHDVGDKFLRVIARRIAGGVRELDLVGRLGGDEFAILVEGADEPEKIGRELAEGLIARLREPVMVDGHELRAGVSIGISLFGVGPEETVKSVVREADYAMYLAKIAGKGSYRFFHDDNRDFAPHVY